MAKEQTLSIIKPEIVARNQIGAVLAMIEKAGLRVLAARMMHFSREQAERFYAVHKGKHFFDTLIQYITSGPVLVMVAEGENAIALYREIMGATDSKKALPGTIRALFGNMTLMEENAVHGSDSPENAREEIALFFKPEDICPRTR